MKTPFVSIIILNYNGRELLRTCLDSVLKNSYPKSGYEVILVDNASTDGSASFVEKHFPSVKVIRSSENLGFTGGNNLGLEHAKGSYIVLLNSDTRVEKEWLQELVKAAKPKHVGMLSSKLYYMTPFVELEIDSSIVSKSDIADSVDFSPLGIMVEDVVCRNSGLSSLVWYGTGFYEKHDGDIVTRWTRGRAHVLVPYQDKEQEEYRITIHGYQTDRSVMADVSIKCGGDVLHRDVVDPHKVRQYTIKLPRKKVEKRFVWLVQNAGNAVFHDGYGRDCGAVILRTGSEMREFYERDSKYFSQPRDLISVCGASCLIKREVIERVGFFDGHYFVYYEDLDLSFRAWKAGWDIHYVPKSVVYHRHRATTSKHESAFFLFHVEKNHLAFLWTHFPLIACLKESYLFFMRYCIALLKMTAFQFKDNLERFETWKVKYEGRRDALVFILRSLPRFIRARWFFKRANSRTFRDMERYLY